MIIIDEALNLYRLTEFLEALIKGGGKKEFLILDNLQVCHSKPTKACAAEHMDKIELLFSLAQQKPRVEPGGASQC